MCFHGTLSSFLQPVLHLLECSRCLDGRLLINHVCAPTNSAKDSCASAQNLLEKSANVDTSYTLGPFNQQPC
jgi:hypothetical protein